MFTIKLAAHITIKQIDSWCKRGGELQRLKFFFITTEKQDLAFDIIEANKR